MIFVKPTLVADAVYIAKISAKCMYSGVCVRFLNALSISRKLMLVLAFPLAGLVYFSTTSLLTQVATWHQAEQLEQLTSLSGQSSLTNQPAGTECCH